MRRAIYWLLVILLLAAVLPDAPAAKGQLVESINGIGLLDYGRKPDFKLGSWVKYHMTGHSELGLVDDYDVTVAVTGEENLWGEDCFWVETLTEAADGTANSVATLMSYSVFRDSLGFVHMKYYMRKTITEFDEQGEPIQSVTRQAPEAIRTRPTEEDSRHFYVDTLGTDTVTVGLGTFTCRKVHMKQGVGSATDRGDSTVYTEVREDRDVYLSPRVPLTGIVREDVDYSIKRKTWLVGRSQEARLNTMDRSVGRATLVAFGEHFEHSVIPESLRKSLKEQRAAASVLPATRPAKRAGARKPG